MTKSDHRNNIFVVGRKEIDKHSIISSVIGENDALSNQTIIPWRIETKYYTADVSFWIKDTDQDKSKQTMEIMETSDAFIFVFDKCDKQSFNDIKRFMTLIEMHSPSINLVIGVGDKNDMTRRDIEYYETWCISNGFEYVDYPGSQCQDEDEDEEDEENETCGAARILEALQSHMWDGHIKRKDQNEPIQEHTKSLEFQEEFVINSELTDQRLEKAIFSLKLDADKVDSIKENTEIEDDDIFDNLISSNVTEDEELDNLHAQLFSGWDDESQAGESMERTMQKIKSMREKVKDLPLDKRRKMAAMVALSFGMQL